MAILVLADSVKPVKGVVYGVLSRKKQYKILKQTKIYWPFLVQLRVTNCIPINIRLRDDIEVVEHVRQRSCAANCETAFNEICAWQLVTESIEKNPIIFTETTLALN